ncbi:MAG: hypothetical protein RBT11_18935 [Desulfobacterales bacterium]|jgi:hypothetical protein|nr:hypothetical protein [Desulfobacterales bacterium]
MPEEAEKLSLINIIDGGAVEMFDRAMERVLENINDINTTLKPREIDLKVTFAPIDDRTLVVMNVQCVPKLQGQEGIKFTADLRIDSRGRAYAMERRSMQRPLPLLNVTELSKQN